MKLESLRDLYVAELRDIYDAERQIVKALPKVIKSASSAELQQALKDHLKQTEGHAQRIEQIFSDMGDRAKGKKCDGMKGVLEEGEDLLEEDAEPSVRDAGIISSAQRVEHYEIAAYGSLRTWALHLGEEAAARLLEQTLEEEQDADQKLTDIAESEINVEAAESEASGSESLGVVAEGETGEITGVSSRARTRRGRKRSGADQRQ